MSWPATKCRRACECWANKTGTWKSGLALALVPGLNQPGFAFAIELSIG
jgi:hypothetical protein